PRGAGGWVAAPTPALPRNAAGGGGMLHIQLAAEGPGMLHTALAAEGPGIGLSPAAAGGWGAGDRRIAYAAYLRGARSKAIRPRGSPRRNWRTGGSCVAWSWSGVPSNTLPPLASTTARSAMGRVSCTWWVTIRLVRPRRSLSSETRFMITPEAIGSSPVS